MPFRFSSFFFFEFRHFESGYGHTDTIYLVHTVHAYGVVSMIMSHSCETSLHH